MKKKEAERTIKSLVHEWARERHGSSQLPPEIHPSFSEFKRWLNARDYSGYLDFRSTIGADYDAEM